MFISIIYFNFQAYYGYFWNLFFDEFPLSKWLLPYSGKFRVISPFTPIVSMFNVECFGCILLWRITHFALNSFPAWCSVPRLHVSARVCKTELDTAAARLSLGYYFSFFLFSDFFSFHLKPVRATATYLLLPLIGLLIVINNIYCVSVLLLCMFNV